MTSLGPVDCGKLTADSKHLFELGLMYATGRSRPIDLVSAHMCFNLAATSGHQEAIARRREIATEMSSAEIATAQRAARAWSVKLFGQQTPAAPMAAAA